MSARLKKEVHRAEIVKTRAEHKVPEAPDPYNKGAWLDDSHFVVDFQGRQQVWVINPDCTKRFVRYVEDEKR